MPPENFGGLPEEHSRYETSRAVIFPIPLERTTSYEHGTRNGPSAILAASRNMELYDEELELEPYKEIGIHTLPAIDTADDPARASSATRITSAAERSRSKPMVSPTAPLSPSIRPNSACSRRLAHFTPPCCQAVGGG